MVLAFAGVSRLGWEESIGEIVPLEVILPAVGQGAIAVEIRTGDRAAASVLAGINDGGTASAVGAERALLRVLEGGCQVPIGAFARAGSGPERDVLRMDAMVASLDGSKVVRGKTHGPASAAEDIGRALAETLLAGGAGAILGDIRSGAPAS